MAEETPVCLGMHIRIRHQSTGMLLTALDRAYVHPNTSGQLMVVGKKTYPESTLWQVMAGSETGDGPPSRMSGKIVKTGDVIRLGEIPTGNRLHSHGDRLSYTQERSQQEVTMWHGPTDYNDDWIVEPERGDTWVFDRPVRIVHKATGKNLHSHQRSDPTFTAGFQEVTGFSGRDPNDFWIAERDGGSGAISPNKELPVAIAIDSGRDSKPERPYAGDLSKLPPNFRQALAVRCLLRAIPLLARWGNFSFWSGAIETHRQVLSITRAVQAAMINCTDNKSRSPETRTAIEAAREAANEAWQSANIPNQHVGDVLLIIVNSVKAGLEDFVTVYAILHAHNLLYPGAGNAALRDYERLVEFARTEANWAPAEFFRTPIWYNATPREWETDSSSFNIALHSSGVAWAAGNFVTWTTGKFDFGEIGKYIEELESWARERAGQPRFEEPPTEKSSTEQTRNEDRVSKWDNSFTAYRRNPQLPWSSTVDAILEHVWQTGREVLLDAAKRPRELPRLSPRVFFLAALHIAKTSENKNGSLRWLSQVSHLRSDRVKELLCESFFGPYEMDVVSTESSVTTKNFDEVVVRADQLRKSIGADSQISARHAFSVLFETTAGRAFLSEGEVDVGRLIAEFREFLTGNSWARQYGEMAHWHAVIPNIRVLIRQRQEGESPSRSPRIGGCHNFLRNATGEEIVLGVDGYAKVLARLFRASDDKDLCIAIFGPWGRGKTFLMDQVVKELKATNTEGQRNYEVVKFSAWKFPSRPEVWIHLYEAVFCKLRGAGWWKSLAHVIRAGIERHGLGKLIGIWAALLITAFPKGWLFKGVDEYFRGYLYAIDSSLAIASAIFAILFVVKLWKTKDILEANFLRVPRHVEKLGLQATIGDDLRALLKGWVDVPPDWGSRHHGWRWFTAAIAFLVGAILWRSGSAWQLGIGFSFLIVAPAIAVRIAFVKAAKSPDRLLLIVDDLDRCHFDHLLTVMESTKLLLEDGEISRRIQVVMLIEEDVLKHAIWEKYKRLTEKEAKKELSTEYDGRRIVRENLDKLFTAHLRLSPLTPGEINEVVLAFGGQTTTQAVSSQNARSESEKATVAPLPDREESPAAVAQRTRIGELPAQLPEANRAATVESDRSRERDAQSAISSDEKKIILAALVRIYGDKHAELGPRALRAFMFRYQLARLILEERGDVGWTPEELADAIASRQFSGVASTAETRPQISTVANQVA